MITSSKRNVLGIGIDATDYGQAVGAILNAAKGRQAYAVTALAVHGVVTAALDRFHRFRLNHFDLVLPDGQPVRWSFRLLYGVMLPDRVYGPKLMLLVCQAAAREGIPICLYGSTEPVLERLRQGLQDLCPGLKVCAAYPSRFRRLTREERDGVVAEIKASGALIVFAGLGCPRQEVFAYEMAAPLSMPVVAVGAAFDYHAGLLREPPAILQQIGLQWLYRLAEEPRRLWKRYLVTNTVFVFLLFLQVIRIWRPDLRNSKPPVAEVLFG